MTFTETQAVVFDLDGTLLNTLDDLTDAMDHALGALGRKRLGRERVRRFVGNGVPKLIRRALLFTDGAADIEADDAHPLFDSCLNAFVEYYNAHGADKTRPYDGAEQMLDGLVSLGIKTAIVTNKYDTAAKSLVRKFFGDVDVVVGVRDGIRPKPSADGVELALKELGVSRSRAVYVGDGETDIATARNAGLPVVAVTWGFRDRALLEELKPDMMIDAPRELVGALREKGLL